MTETEPTHTAEAFDQITDALFAMVLETTAEERARLMNEALAAVDRYVCAVMDEVKPLKEGRTHGQDT